MHVRPKKIPPQNILQLHFQNEIQGLRIAGGKIGKGETSKVHSSILKSEHTELKNYDS